MSDVDKQIADGSEIPNRSQDFGDLSSSFETLKKTVTMGFDSHNKQKEKLEKSHNQIVQKLHTISSSIEVLSKAINETEERHNNTENRIYDIHNNHKELEDSNGEITQQLNTINSSIENLTTSLDKTTTSHEISKTHLDYIRDNHEELKTKTSSFERFRYLLYGGAAVAVGVLGYGWFNIASPIEENKKAIAAASKSHNDSINAIAINHEITIKEIVRQHSETLTTLSNTHSSAVSSLDNKISKINDRIDVVYQVKTTKYKPLHPDFDGLIAFGVNDIEEKGCLNWGIFVFDFTKQTKTNFQIKHHFHTSLSDKTLSNMTFAEANQEIEKVREKFHKAMESIPHASFKNYKKTVNVPRSNDLIILTKIDLPIRLKITQLFGSPVSTVAINCGSETDIDKALANEIALASGYETVVSPPHYGSSCLGIGIPKIENAPAPPKKAPAPAPKKASNFYRFSPIPDPLFAKK